MAARQAMPTALTEHAGTIADVYARAKAGPLRLILLDLMMPDVQGFAGLVMLRQLQPNAAIAIVSSNDQPSLMRRAAQHGANGYIPKSTPMSGMIDAISILIAGGQSFPVETFADGDQDPETPAVAQRIAELSTAQLRVLQMAASGRQNKQIAYELGVAETTVKTHLAQTYRKLAVTNRTQAILALQTLDITR
jgi:DNA-binding NarL/FixJ family response regulator